MRILLEIFLLEGSSYSLQEENRTVVDDLFRFHGTFDE
jgi:hypothetical protein